MTSARGRGTAIPSRSSGPRGRRSREPGKDGIDRCVVDSIRDPIPHKKRKASVPEERAYQCYAQLQSLIKLAGDQKDEYETVPESDPRPKHVHLKYKLDLAEKGRTWRILAPRGPPPSR